MKSCFYPNVLNVNKRKSYDLSCILILLDREFILKWTPKHFPRHSKKFILSEVNRLN